MKKLWLGITLSVFLIVGALICFHAQFAALLWHLRNGRNLTWKSYSMILPIMWHPVVDSEHGVLRLRHAAIFGVEHELVFTQAETQSHRESADAGSRWQKSTVDKINSRANANPFQAYTVVTDDGDVYCIGSSQDDPAVSFVCKAMGGNLDIRFLGNSADALDARAIVSSLR